MVCRLDFGLESANPLPQINISGFVVLQHSPISESGHNLN
uniref:Uncharacterized protein n=1 Tax=Anguilla anguilla TaxID=7936 RepID=A0A0E9WBQ1_ANGAN